MEEAFYLTRMTVIKNLTLNEMTVTYIATHTNHELSINENKFLPLASSVKQEVEQKFS